MTVDLSPLNSLLLYDVDPTDIANRARTFVQSAVPGLQLRVGDMETTLIDAFALEVAEAIYAINRVPNATIEGIITLFGAPRDPGAYATVEMLFSLSTPATVIIAEGTTLRIRTDTDSIVFVTTDNVITSGTTATVPAIATEVGSMWNGIPAGTAVDLLSVIPQVDSVITANSIGDGRDPEDTNAWLARVGHRFARVTDSLVRADDFEAYALEQPGVTQARAINNYDADAHVNSYGHITVAVAGPDGATVPPAIKAVLLSNMLLLAAVNLEVHLTDVTVTPVDVTAEIELRPGYDPDLVQQAAIASLAAFLDPNTWPFDSTVEVADLVAELDRTAGVQSAVVTVPSADVSLTGLAPVPTLGTATITFSS